MPVAALAPNSIGVCVCVLFFHTATASIARSSFFSCTDLYSFFVCLLLFVGNLLFFLKLNTNTVYTREWLDTASGLFFSLITQSNAERQYIEAIANRLTELCCLSIKDIYVNAY